MSSPPATEPDDLRPMVRAAWATVLGHDRFVDSDDLFANGATSLRAMKVGRALGRDLTVRVPIRIVMENRTVADLAAAVDAIRREREGC